MATSVDETTTTTTTTTNFETDQLAEDDLECTVCFERFQELKVLRCQHMHCKKCLERLVTRIGRGHYAITCPECRQNTEVPDGNVMRLQSKYVINRSISRPSCTKHNGEILLFCQTCDKLICRDCIVVHRDHKYSFIEDIFAAEKEKILKLESKVIIRALESYIETLKEQEESIDKNCLEVRQKRDSFIDKKIELLDYLKNNTESIAQNLSKGSEMEILSTKINSGATANLKPRGRISYDLEADPALDENTVGKMAKIRQYDKEAKIGQYDKEYKLTIVPGISSGKGVERELLRSPWGASSQFYIRPKCKNAIFSPDNKVRVNIKSPKLNKVYSPVISKGRDGYFSFSHQPGMMGNFKIEIMINGSPIHGSPFTWKVLGF